MLGGFLEAEAEGGAGDGDKLAFTGGVKDQILDIETLAVRFLTVMRDNYPEMLTERYKITDFADKEPYEILEMIGRKRGIRIRHQRLDLLRQIQAVENFKKFLHNVPLSADGQAVVRRTALRFSALTACHHTLSSYRCVKQFKGSDPTKGVRPLSVNHFKIRILRFPPGALRAADPPVPCG